MKLLNWNLIILMLLSLVVMPIVTAEILRALGNHTKQRLVDNFGVTSQVAIGGLGVIIHELAHLITAIIFGHHIRHFSLLEPRKYQLTGSLGYVDHTWHPNNLYESLGNFLIGLAPCFACSECLWLIHGYLFGKSITTYASIPNVTSAINAATINVGTPFGPLGWQLLVYLVLIVMVASTGYGLSDEDMKGAYSGLPYWLTLLVIIYLLVIFTGTSSVLTIGLWKLTILWLTFLGRGLIYLITSLILIDGLSLI